MCEEYSYLLVRSQFSVKNITKMKLGLAKLSLLRHLLSPNQSQNKALVQMLVTG